MLPQGLGQLPFIGGPDAAACPFIIEPIASTDQRGQEITFNSASLSFVPRRRVEPRTQEDSQSVFETPLMRDADVIAAADQRGLAMVFTGMRHFRH
jgi:hypothetical protein